MQPLSKITNRLDKLYDCHMQSSRNWDPGGTEKQYLFWQNEISTHACLFSPVLGIYIRQIVHQIEQNVY